MCYFGGRLFITEQLEEAEAYRYRLAAYNVTNQDSVTLLDTMDLGTQAGQPRVDRQSGQIYIPCRRHNGVRVVMYDGRKLVPVSTLRCVRNPDNLAVVHPDKLYVSDLDSHTICLVDVTQDRITERLQTEQLSDSRSLASIAVLADTVLAVYGGPKLVIY